MFLTFTAFFHTESSFCSQISIHPDPSVYYRQFGFGISLMVGSKGQIKPKAVWARHRFSQKLNKRICFVCLEKQKSKQNRNSFIRFLGESTALQSAFNMDL